MAVLYTNQELQEMLQELRIKPEKGLVNTKEAATILTWRAKHEQGVIHEYPESAVRRHVELDNLKIARKRGKIANLYKVEAVLDLPLTPNRGLKQQKAEYVARKRAVIESEARPS